MKKGFKQTKSWEICQKRRLKNNQVVHYLLNIRKPKWFWNYVTKIYVTLKHVFKLIYLSSILLWEIRKLQRVPGLREFWDLKITLHEIRVSGTVLKTQLTQKSPTWAYIRQNCVSRGPRWWFSCKWGIACNAVRTKVQIKSEWIYEVIDFPN